MKAHNKLSNSDRQSNDRPSDQILAQADQDLEKVIEMENFQDIQVVITSKMDLSAELKILKTIEQTFSQIFQALIVMLETKNKQTNTQETTTKLSRRSKEFEARLNRSVFETKQQVIVCGRALHLWARVLLFTLGSKKLLLFFSF